MIETNGYYGNAGPSQGLKLDSDLLYSHQVFGLADATSTAAVDHYLAFERGVGFESDYAQGLRLSVFDDSAFPKSHANESQFMPAPTMDPLFFGRQRESVFEPVDIYSLGLPECPKDADAMPEIWYPIFRFEDLEKFLEENSIDDLIWYPVIRFEDMKKTCVVYL